MLEAREYLSRREAANYLSDRGLKLSKESLQKFATVGGGPRYSIFGSRAVYARVDLDAWVVSKLKPRGSTSEAA